MKKEFAFPEVEIIRFTMEDIVTSSGCPNDCGTCTVEGGEF